MDTPVGDLPASEAAQRAALERQKLVERLLARLAHEVRNPLGSLGVHVQLLEEDLHALTPLVPKEVGERLHVIRTELRRLDHIVSDFLNLAGRRPVFLQPVALPRLVDHVCRLLGSEACARHIHLSASIPPGIPEVLADEGQLTQALVNLVLNALQAVGRNGRVLLVAELAREGDAVRVDVCDTGTGLPLELRRAVFEPFFTTKPDGSGLGLWIVQQIATNHGGTLTAADGPDGGAIFSLRLPLHPTFPSS